MTSLTERLVPLSEMAPAKLREFIGSVAKRVGQMLPENTLFALFMFEPGGQGLAQYTSNARRDDMIKALKETIARFENGEVNERDGQAMRFQPPDLNEAADNIQAMLERFDKEGLTGALDAETRDKSVPVELSQIEILSLRRLIKHARDGVQPLWESRTT